MTQLHISLTDDANQFVAGMVAAGQYASASEFVQSLIEQARVDAARQRLAALVEEGENSGPGIEYTEEQWEERTRELRARVPREPAA